MTDVRRKSHYERTKDLGPPDRSREPLSRDRILSVAIRLADQDGIASLSMRRIGQELGVEAMSLYNHMASKEEILSGIVELVFAEVDEPAASTSWKVDLRERALSQLAGFQRHPWALDLLQTRNSARRAVPSSNDRMREALRTAGFPAAMAAHALSLLESFVYGYALRHSMPSTTGARQDYDADDFESELNLLFAGLDSARRAAWTQVLG